MLQNQMEPPIARSSGADLMCPKISASISFTTEIELRIVIVEVTAIPRYLVESWCLEMRIGFEEMSASKRMN